MVETDSADSAWSTRRRSFSTGAPSGETSRRGMHGSGFGEKPQPKKTRHYFALGFHRDGGGFGELKGQPRPGGESGIVFLLLSIAGLGFFVGRTARVGNQVAVDSVDDDRREHHLQFMSLYFVDAASDRSTSGKHGLPVYLDGPRKPSRERITPVILVGGEGLPDRRGDLCAFRQGDEMEWLRRVGGVGRRACRAGSRGTGGVVRRACRTDSRGAGGSAANSLISNLRGLAAGYRGGLVRAPRHGQEAENRSRKR